MKTTFDTKQDALKFLFDSGWFDTVWCDKCSLEGYEHFLAYEILNDVQGEFWDNGLEGNYFQLSDYCIYAYLVSRGASPGEYGCAKPTNFEDFAEQCL